MRKFELYLDESGSFIDEESSLSPSLIGGILVKKDELTIEKAQLIMQTALSKVDGKYVHINDIAQKDKKLAGKVAVDIIQEIVKMQSRIVIFENNELLDFKDDKLLYLNIMAEGIINLLEKLSLENPEPVELNVIAAVRRNLEIDDDKTVIEMEEYSKRIKEKIYIKIAEKDLFLSKNCKVNFELSSARKNPKLMLSDVVCNARLTRNSSKFNEEQKQYLESIFDKSKYVFNVFRTNIQKKLSEYLIQNNIVDAIFLLNEVDDEKTKKELITLIATNINNMPTSNLRIQLELLSLKIRSIIDVQRNLLLCEKFLLNLQQNIMPKIKVKGFIINKLKIDISLYLLTIYTHQGNNIKSKEQIQISENELKNISGSWEFLEYYYILKIRQAIYYNTCFKNNKTIEVLTVAVEKFENVLNAMQEIEEFGNMKSDMIAKAVGTRLQSYTNLITPNLDENTKKQYYENAVKDSEFAISQFVSESDKRRQYQYRCMLELSVGNFDDAVRFLMKTVGMTEKNFEKFLELVSQISDFSKNFILVNYLEVMQHAINEKNIQLGIAMFEAYKSNESIFKEFSLEQIDEDSIYSNNSKFMGMHPFEIIYWSLGKYYRDNNKDLAIKYFDKAIEICNEINESTIFVVELAIEADKLCLSKNINEDKKVLIDKYNNIMNNLELEDIHEFLNSLKDEFELVNLFEDVAEVRVACRKIANEIRV